MAHLDGACAATSHLIRLGHRRLAVIAGPLHLTNAQQRLAGFRRSLKQAKISIAPEYVQESTFIARADTLNLSCCFVWCLGHGDLRQQ